MDENLIRETSKMVTKETIINHVKHIKRLITINKPNSRQQQAINSKDIREILTSNKLISISNESRILIKPKANPQRNIRS